MVRIPRGAIGSISIKFGNAVLMFLVSVLLARILGASSFGIYAFAYALVNVLAIPAKLGLPQLVIRETARFHATQEWGSMLGIWRWSTLVVIITSLVISLAVVVIVYTLGLFNHNGRATTLLVGVVFIPMFALGNLRGAALRGLRKIVLGQLPESILRPGLFIVFIACAYFFIPAVVTPVTVMGLHAGAAGFAFLVGAVLLSANVPSGMKDGPLIRYDTKQWLRAVLPLGASASIQLVNQYADIIFLGVLGSNAEVGIYRVVVQGAMLVTFGLQAVDMAVSPYFARFHFQGERARLQYLVTQSSRIAVAIALPLVLIYAIFGRILLSNVFGEEYAAGYIPLLILAFGQLISAAMGSVRGLLNMTGHERYTMRGVLFAALINLILNAVLIPIYGMVGAATATAASVIFWNMSLKLAAKRHLGLEVIAFKRLKPRPI